MLKKLLDYAIGYIDDEVNATNSDENLNSNIKTETTLTNNEEKKISTNDEENSCPCHSKKCCECTNRKIPFTGIIKTCVDILDIKCPPTLIGYNINANCKKSECKKTVDVPICDQILKCDTSLDMLTFEGNAKLVLSINALLNLDCPEKKEVPLVTCADIKIHQHCFACKCEGLCPCTKCNLLKLESIHAKKLCPNEIIISGYMTFTCPYKLCE